MSDALAEPALEQARLVREGEVSSRELVEAALARAEELQERLNCFVSIDAERALEAADDGVRRRRAAVRRRADRGQGHRRLGKHHTLTMGSDLFGDFAPGFHSHAVRRLEESGLVSIGQTTVPELGIVNVTEGRRYGPTRNPWDPSRTPGRLQRRRGRGGGRRRVLDRPRLATAAARCGSPRPAAGWWA